MKCRKATLMLLLILTLINVSPTFAYTYSLSATCVNTFTSNYTEIPSGETPTKPEKPQKSPDTGNHYVFPVSVSLAAIFIAILFYSKRR